MTFGVATAADNSADIPAALQRRCSFDVAGFAQRLVFWHGQHPDVLTAYADVPEIVAGGQMQGTHPARPSPARLQYSSAGQHPRSNPRPASAS